MSKMDQASKEAWQWVERTEAGAITIDHIQTSYRLKVATCKPGKCKKNCKINPRCLVGLGEKVWLEDLKVTEEEPEDPCDVVRTEGNFVGLTNLGATCYINSLLQLWFHNPIFRKAIYSWVPFFDPSEKDNKTFDLLGIGGFIPSSPVGKLQLLFAQMQFSKRSCVNPTSLITSLGIDTTTQQDAQEFSKLFLNLLEDKLTLQTDQTVSTMVHDQFRGEYEYVTRCSKCQKESSSPSAFYELDLSLGGKSDVTLDECLAEFLHEEKLEGTDQYFCENCSSKQNATRSIRLRHLPAMLNIQLLRFVFDRKTGLKKKVSSMVHFPFVIEMSNYVKTQGVAPSSLTYDLSAVLIHRGPSAYSGHYIAHIKDPVSGTWYKFNDEVVQKIEGTNFKLGIEEDLEDSKKNRAGAKVIKGSHGSSNAYMLVYSRRDTAKPESVPACSPASSSDPCSVLPPWVQTTIFNENENFEAWNRNTVSRKDESLKKNREKHSKMRRLYGSLPCTSLEQGEFIPTQWLLSWLGNDEKLGPIDTSSLLCEHGKLNPEKFREYKLVSSSAADELYAEYSGGKRLDINDLCWDCVTTKCITSQLRSQLDNESKLIANLMKSKIEPNQPAFWIGKESLRSWKKMVLERRVNSERESVKMKNGIEKTSSQIEEEISVVPTKSKYKFERKRSNGHSGRRSVELDHRFVRQPDRSEWQAEFEKTLEWENRPSSSSSMGEIGFNEDLLCPHDKLTADEGPRRLIHAAVWEILHRHFPEAVEFSSSEPPCERCIRMVEQEGQTKESNKQLAAEQKALLQDLFRAKNRPDPFAPQNGEIYVVAKEVIDKWRSFIRDSSRKEPMTCMSNAQLLCHHDGLLHRPSPDLESETRFVYLWPYEWDALSRFAKVDRVILIRRVVSESGAGFSLNTEPAVCESCLEERLEEERRSQLVYSRAAIYVRQVDKIGALTDNLMDVPSASALSTSIAEDPDFQMGSETKRPRLDSSAQSLAVSCPLPSLSPATTGQQQARRSSRQRRGRAEKEITVSSDQTLLDLKRDIMKKFQVAPFDQHLTCEGRDLNDNQATLASLRIFPGTVIILQADEPSEDPSLMEDYARTAIPEEGFKGTELLRS